MKVKRGLLQRDEAPQISYERQSGTGPTLVWLGGLRSDIHGPKAVALAEAARAKQWPLLRFDYAAHGASGGRWEDCTIGSWRSDALDVVDTLTAGPLVLVGSSMGAWLACLVALARPHRVTAMVLVAPATDLTEALMRPSLTPERQQELDRTGAVAHRDEYGSYAITRRFLEEGRDWSILGGPIAIRCPVRILQGGRDEVVPWRHALKLAHLLESEDVVWSGVKDGDHRLSREQDLARLVALVEEARSAAAR